MLMADEGIDKISIADKRESDKKQVLCTASDETAK